MEGLYRAKFHDCSWAFGFYANRKETTYCFVEDYEKEPIEILHCIVHYQMTDWGLPNEVRVTLIDPKTLEYADFIEKDKWWKMYEALHAKRRTDDT